VKPARRAFTRTKMKNLLTGGVIERNIRSGEKLEPAAIEECEMQYLYKEADAFVFMNTKSYEQMHINRDVLGDDPSCSGQHQRAGAPLQRSAIGITLPNFIDLRITQSDPGVRAIPPRM